MERDIKQDGPGVHHCWSWVKGASFYFFMSPIAGESREMKRNCAISYKPKRWTFKVFYILWSSLCSFFLPSLTPHPTFFLPWEYQLHVCYLREVNRKTSLALNFLVKAGNRLGNVKSLPETENVDQNLSLPRELCHLLADDGRDTQRWSTNLKARTPFF